MCIWCALATAPDEKHGEIIWEMISTFTSFNFPAYSYNVSMKIYLPENPLWFLWVGTNLRKHQLYGIPSLFIFHSFTPMLKWKFLFKALNWPKELQHITGPYLLTCAWSFFWKRNITLLLSSEVSAIPPQVCYTAGQYSALKRTKVAELDIQRCACT